MHNINEAARLVSFYKATQSSHCHRRIVIDTDDIYNHIVIDTDDIYNHIVIDTDDIYNHIVIDTYDIYNHMLSFNNNIARRRAETSLTRIT